MRNQRTFTITNQNNQIKHCYYVRTHTEGAQKHAQITRIRGIDQLKVELFVAFTFPPLLARDEESKKEFSSTFYVSSMGYNFATPQPYTMIQDKTPYWP